PGADIANLFLTISKDHQTEQEIDTRNDPLTLAYGVKSGMIKDIGFEGELMQYAARRSLTAMQDNNEFDVVIAASAQKRGLSTAVRVNLRTTPSENEIHVRKNAFLRDAGFDPDELDPEQDQVGVDEEEEYLRPGDEAGVDPVIRPITDTDYLSDEE